MNNIESAAFCTLHACPHNRDMKCTKENPTTDECPFVAMEEDI